MMKYLLINKSVNGSVDLQIENVLKELISNIVDNNLSVKNTVLINCFVTSNDSKEYLECQRVLQNIIREYLKDMPALSLIAQSSAAKSGVVMEAWVLENESKGKIRRVSYQGHPYVIIEYPEWADVFSGGISFCDDSNFIFNTQKTFDFAEQLLGREEMDFGHVVRQWNYVEDILKFDQTGGKNLQHYQIFNDIRALYYDISTIKYGFPAATGIGTDAGGLGINFYAVSGEAVSDETIKSITSPVQNSAYEYSKIIMEGDSMNEAVDKNAPCFERGKYVNHPDGPLIFISGTAAIEGEITSSATDAATQTNHTIDVIRELCSKDNLLKHELKHSSINSFEMVRVYIKRLEDFEVIKGIVEDRLGTKKVNYLLADVCRDKLLVEIEAVVSLK